ncbi:MULTISPECIES: response regulator [unclassified Caulobacter]|uniref:response regulator n=1 Tax=unclassified Caulobacter TaxID=2648921 RepID=UPI001E3FE908|nr:MULTISPECIES: response regulator [unclassified Caulobacter]
MAYAEQDPWLVGAARSYVRPAKALRQQIPLRLFVIAVICAAVGMQPWLAFMFPWALGCLAAQILQAAALRAFDRDPERWILPCLAADFLLAVAFGWASVPLWKTGLPSGAAGASLLLAGSILTALMGAKGSRLAFAATVTPHLAYLFLAPALVGGHHDPGIRAFLAGCGLMALVTALVFGWSRHTLMAEREARAAAEIRREQAVAADAAKSAFVAMVSHELRTPLSAILAGAGEIARTSRGQARGKAGLIADAGVMMRALLNDLLDLSKIEAGRMTVESIDFAPRLLICDTLRFWRAEARDKGLALRFTGGRHLPRWIKGDPVRLRQVLNNLLSNAIKFTPEGRICVALEMTPRAEGGLLLTLAVTDTGPGLGPEQLARLFTAYDQLGADTARTFGGTGLGLAISRDLARLMGGDLAAEPVEGPGARFVLTLPAPVGEEPPAPEPLDASADGFDDAPTVLVVDDHEINRRTLAQVLEAFGLDVTLAADGESALVLAGETRFDVVLMDVNMPGLDGLDTTRRLRADGLNQQTPVVAVTGAVSPAEMAACRAAGMQDFVEKPFEVAALHAVLVRMLGAA